MEETALAEDTSISVSLISYLNAKRLNLGDIAEKVEARRFWPSGGEYLNKSTLKTHALDLNSLMSLLRTRPYEGSSNESGNLRAGMILGADIRDTDPDDRDALIKSMKRL
ncbi:hypothetical protein N7465_008494 [Penicillium sp. CMV-2018d]|nr:hypothetical protein N7465_008494 [Penicillium sp. CMV-2018d]